MFGSTPTPHPIVSPTSLRAVVCAINRAMA
jgi:hypothetical protein